MTKLGDIIRENDQFSQKVLVQMDQAMSGNELYFQAFYEDLVHQRHEFGEENDAYVEWVSKSILCYYQR